MSKIHLWIAGHGKNKNGTFDPGATNYISKGEHRFFKEDFFPLAEKYAKDSKDTFIFFSEYNVYSYKNLVELVKKVKADTVTEFHFDSHSSDNVTGGHVIIHKDFKPDTIDLKIKDVIHEMVGTRLQHNNQKGISGRNNLQNVIIAKNNNINYRLPELFMSSNKNDVDRVLNGLELYALQMVRAFDNDVRKEGKESPKKEPLQNVKSIERLAQEVIEGKHGSGEKRKQNLGNMYKQVQNRVNEILLPSKKKSKSLTDIASEVVAGKWGNDPERHDRLKNAGYNPVHVQNMVNRMVGHGRKESLNQLVNLTLNGDFGNGEERKQKLGSRYQEVQNEINRRMR